MNQYGFFDNSYVLAEKGYTGSDRLSLLQFIVMGLLFIIIVAISIFLRKVKKEKVLTIYKVLAVVMPILEISKIIFSTYADLTHDQPFNLGGMLPLYSCSMLLYFLPFVAWGKGKMQKYSMAFFSSIGLVAGLSNFVYLSAAGWYPIFTFGGLYSVTFHGVIVFVGISLLITELYEPSYKTIYEGMIPVVLFSLIVIPANFIIKNVPNNGSSPDYMMLMDANGFIPVISDFFINNNIQWLFSLLMLFVAYPIATALIVLIVIGIEKLVKQIFKDKNNTPHQDVETVTISK